MIERIIGLMKGRDLTKEANDILTLLREEINKELLTAEELFEFLYHVKPSAIILAEGFQNFLPARWQQVTQAQLQKILKALEEK
jgi:hypothetical protein